MAVAGLRCGDARADEGDGAPAVDRDTPPPPAEVGPTAEAGAFLSLAQPAALRQTHSLVLGTAGYDSVSRSATYEASAEVRLWGPVVLRGGAVRTADNNRLRPSFGARLELLHEDAQGIDGSVGVSYRPEGLTEPEGEIETLLAAGRHLGRTYVLGNLLYGQDAEGSERDGEVRLAVLCQASGRSRWVYGLDSRARFDLGSDASKLTQNHEAALDALVGPMVGVHLGPVTLALQGGGAARRRAGTAAYGAFTMLAVGYVWPTASRMVW